jgi:hypothetical protein
MRCSSVPCERDVTKTVRSMLGLEKQPYASALAAIKEIYKTDASRVENAYRYRLGFYQTVSPLQYQHYSGLSIDDKLDHLARLVENGGLIFYPTDHEYEIADVARRLQQEYNPTYGPVSYVGYSGQRVVTQYPVRIAPLYMMLLDKITDALSSVACRYTTALRYLITRDRERRSTRFHIVIVQYVLSVSLKVGSSSATVVRKP